MNHQEIYVSLDIGSSSIKVLIVEIGQDVNIETQIGTVGSTGMSTGPHLHLEMTYNDELIDPSPFIFNPDSDTTPAY